MKHTDMEPHVPGPTRKLRLSIWGPDVTAFPESCWADTSVPLWTALGFAKCGSCCYPISRVNPGPERAAVPGGAPGGRPGLVVWPHKQLAEQAVLVAWEDTLTFQLGQETAGSWGLLGPGWLGTAFWRGVQVSQIVGDGGELFMSLPRHWGFRSDPIGATSQSENWFTL